VTEEEERWDSEEIPPEDFLYVFVHKQWIRNGRIVPGFFQNRPDEATGAMSTDWSRYSTPEDTRKRARKPEVNGVGEMRVGVVRQIPMQTVVHTPIYPGNRAHTDVIGPKQEADLDIQVQFSKICELIASPPTE
jgi:hypothetical protein